MKTRRDVIVFATVVMRLAAVLVAASGFYSVGLAFVSAPRRITNEAQGAAFWTLIFTVSLGAVLWFASRMVAHLVSSDLFDPESDKFSSSSRVETDERVHPDNAE